MITAIVISAIIALAVGGFVGYHVGKTDGVNAGYTNGYNVAKNFYGPKPVVAAAKVSVKPAKAGVTKLVVKAARVAPKAKRGRPRKSK